MKFGELIECKMRNIILQKSYIECGGEASPRPFFKKSKLNISLDQQSEMLLKLFLLYVQVEVHQIILNLRCWPLSLTLYKTFSKNEKRPGISLLHDLRKNLFLSLYFTRLTKFHCLITITYWGIAAICIL